METCKSAEKRLNKVLENTYADSVLVTHEGPTGRFVTRYNGLPDAYLDRGAFIELQNFAGEWLPTHINRVGIDSYAGKDI